MLEERKLEYFIFNLDKDLMIRTSYLREENWELEVINRWTKLIVKKRFHLTVIDRVIKPSRFR